MEIEVEFNYGGQKVIIQCNTDDKFKNIYQKYINKSEVNSREKIFLYNGEKKNENKTIKEIINNFDKERKKMSIIVSERDNDSNQAPVIIKPKDISCPKCGDNA